MNQPEGEPPGDPSEQELAGQLAQYDEALRTADRPPLDVLNLERLSPEAARLLEQAQAGIQRLRRARPGGSSAGNVVPDTCTWRKLQPDPFPTPTRPSIKGYEIVDVLGRGNGSASVGRVSSSIQP